MSKNMKFPLRTAPSVDNAKRSTMVKKKPPPRPPPPNFNAIKSKSAWNLNNQFDGLSLIDLSPPESPKPFAASRNHRFGGSVSSSFSSSTSSLASSKRSFEYEGANFDSWGTPSKFYVNNGPAPTIIRPQVAKKTVDLRGKSELRMPTVPPPSPPKEYEEVAVPYGIALYDYRGDHQEDLSFKMNEVIFLIRAVNNEWLYGRIEDREGLFPSNHISIQVPLPDNDMLVTALYEFNPQVVGDLALKPGQPVLVTGKVSADWLLGESNGCTGQFPANFVDRVPSTI